MTDSSTTINADNPVDFSVVGLRFRFGDSPMCATSNNVDPEVAAMRAASFPRQSFTLAEYNCITAGL
jgi:hypothetical protein